MNSQKNYTWGTPKDDKYFNHELMIWRIGQLLFFAICFTPFVVMFISLFVGLLLGAALVLSIYTGLLSTLLSPFEIGRTAEEFRISSEQPRGPADVYVQVSKGIIEADRERYEKELSLYQEKRKAWRKERRSRWMRGNFRQFPMGDWQCETTLMGMSPNASHSELKLELVRRYGV